MISSVEHHQEKMNINMEMLNLRRYRGAGRRLVVGIN